METDRRRKMIFCTVLLGSMVVCAYHSSTLIGKFVTKPVFTDIKRKASQSTMPELLVCNGARAVRGSWITDKRYKQLVKMVKQSRRNLTSTQCKTCINNSWIPDAQTNFITWKNHPYLTEFLGVSFEEFVIKCRYATDSIDTSCNETDFDLVVDPNYLNCFRFKLANQKNSVYELELILWSNSPVDSTTKGALAQIRPSKTSPHSGQWINLGLGVETTITLKQNNIHSYNVPSKPCRKNPPSVSYASLDGAAIEKYEYRAEDCIIEKYYAEYGEACGCLPFDQMPSKVYEKYPYCFDYMDRRNENITEDDIWTRTFIECLIKMGTQKNRILKNITDFECSPPCNTAQYDIDIINIPWLQSHYDSELFISLKNLKDAQKVLSLNLTAIKSFYEYSIQNIENEKILKQKNHGNFTLKDIRNKLKLSDFTNQIQQKFMKVRIVLEPETTDIVESPAYELFQLISDLAGISGVYLGVSVLTLFELYSFLFTFKFCSRKIENDNEKSINRNATVAVESP